MFIAVTAILCDYIVGSISFAIIFTWLFSKKDVRDFGSGNAGMTNVLRVSGALPGVLTFVFDFLKGYAAAYFTGIVFSYVYSATGDETFSVVYGRLLGGFICMIGHILPVFFKFRGGKGVATGVGAFFAICPAAAAIGLGVFAVCMLISRIISLSSLAATAGVVVSFIIIGIDTSAPIIPQIIMSIVLGTLIFIKHKDNIVRLLHGQEKKLSIKRNNK